MRRQVAVGTHTHISTHTHTHTHIHRSDHGVDDVLVGGFLHLDIAQARNDIQLICTSFDDESELFSKYPESRSILRQLARFDNVQVCSMRPFENVLLFLGSSSAWLWFRLCVWVGGWMHGCDVWRVASALPPRRHFLWTSVM